MTSKSVPTTPEGKFAAQVEALIESKLRQQRFVVPMFAADPPETDPTNLWMRYDGRLRGRYWNGASYTYVDYPMRSDITAPPAVPVYPAKPATPLAPQTTVSQWTALWSQTYTGTGTKRTDTIGESNLVFGQDAGGVYSTQKALFGFDYASIVTALTGSTIQSVQLDFVALSTFFGGPVSAFLGMHNQTAEPSTFDVTTTILRYGDLETFVPGGGFSCTIPISFAQQLRAGTAKGIVLEAQNNDKGNSGIVAGVGSGYTPPVLTVTYAK